jgi:hypothetical protein
VSYATSNRPTFYGRLPEERERDNQLAERALFGELIPGRHLVDCCRHVKVAGVTYRNDDGRERQDIIRHSIAQFDEVTLERETDSAQDDNTVRVIAKVEDEPTIIGHLPRDTAAELAPQLDAGRNWRAIITRVGGFPTKGVSLMLYRLGI